MKINKRFFRKLQDTDFVNSLLREEAIREKENEHFYRFECSSFFCGDKLADLNKEIYYECRHNINRRFKHLENIKERL